jgi:hypothetical protein
VTINCASLRTTGGKREKHGATILITKKNGYQTEGELIAVKPNSLLLLSITGRDVSVEIEEIKVITVVKKSKALLGVGTGLLAGAGCGAAIGAILWMLAFPVMAIFDGAGIESWVGYGAGIGAVIFVLLGESIGGFAGKDKTIQIEGMTDSEIKEALDKLRKKARIRDYR